MSLKSPHILSLTSQGTLIEVFLPVLFGDRDLVRLLTHLTNFYCILELSHVFSVKNRNG